LNVGHTNAGSAEFKFLSPPEKRARHKKVRPIAVEAPEGPRAIRPEVLEYDPSTMSQTAVAALISRNLRNHLSSVCCNVEFMSEPSTSHTDRTQLLQEVRGAIGDMTGLLNSLLLSAQTAQIMHPEAASINEQIEHAMNMVRSYLLLNSCQVMKSIPGPRKLEVTLCPHDASVHIRMTDKISCV
jgi:hypothetical protein